MTGVSSNMGILVILMHMIFTCTVKFNEIFKGLSDKTYEGLSNISKRNLRATRKIVKLKMGFCDIYPQKYLQTLAICIHEAPTSISDTLNLAAHFSGK